MILLDELLKETNLILNQNPEISSFFKDIYSAYRVPMSYPALYFEIVSFPDRINYYGFFDITLNFTIFSYDENISLYTGFEILYRNLNNKTFKFSNKKLSINFDYNGYMYTDKDLDKKIFYLQSAWNVYLVKWS